MREERRRGGEKERWTSEGMGYTYERGEKEREGKREGKSIRENEERRLAYYFRH